jgi:hypothetical protein
MAMTRYVLFGAVLAAAALLPGDVALFAGDKTGHKHHVHFEKCAKACADCMRECDSCARHCAELVAQGKKEHLHTLGTCIDCAEVCAAAARIVARRGPMSHTICEACAKVCDDCGAACEKHAGDEHMARCARECRTCATACREMLKHTGAEKK